MWPSALVARQAHPTDLHTSPVDALPHASLGARHDSSAKQAVDDAPADTMGAPDADGVEAVANGPPRSPFPAHAARDKARPARSRAGWPLGLLCCAAPSVADDGCPTPARLRPRPSLSPASSALGPEELNALISSPTAAGTRVAHAPSGSNATNSEAGLSVVEDGCCRVVIGTGAAAVLPAGPAKPPSAAAPAGDAGPALLPPLPAGAVAPRLSLCERRSVAGSEWHDAASDAFDASDLADLPDSPRAEAVPRPLVPQVGPHVPNPPLMMPPKEFRFVPVPDDLSAFHGYWLKDPKRPMPIPHPIDVMLGNTRMSCKAHEAIPGVLVHDHAKTVTVTCKPQNIPLGSLSRYVETFNKDHSKTHWAVRRDVRMGRSCGEMYFTACNTLVLRVWGVGVFSSEADHVCEDYITLSTGDDGGRALINRMCCVHLPTGRQAVQTMFGNYMGPQALPGHA